MLLSLMISQGFTQIELQPLGKITATRLHPQRPILLALLKMTNGEAERPECYRRHLTAKERGRSPPILGPSRHLIRQQRLWLCGTAVALNGTRA